VRGKMMFYLIYVSSAIKLMEEDELLFMLQEAREKNQRLEITGMLLYKEGNFMQMLEGDKKVVLELYDTIIRDVRHKDVITIVTGDIKQRNFETWSMGFYNMNKAGDFPKYSEYIKENLTLRSFQDDSQFAYKFITQFNELNP